MRRINFVNQEIYHIYNRGVDKRDIFLKNGDYLRFVEYLKQVQETKLNSDELSLLDSVEFICYCLNPNHFHFVLKQLRDGGISKFMHFLATSYTMFFNIKYQRSGALFQGPFKAKQVESFEHLLWLSIYVNTNAQIHGITDDAATYPWCSFAYYLGTEQINICNKRIILEEIKNYSSYAKEASSFMKKKKEMEKYLELEA
ncbi:MAG: transposase [Candidatus Parcubacteria bacterium]|nr:transposase [Candidatus Parcubacteria bacterium]